MTGEIIAAFFSVIFIIIYYLSIKNVLENKEKLVPKLVISIMIGVVFLIIGLYSYSFNSFSFKGFLIPLFIILILGIQEFLTITFNDRNTNLKKRIFKFFSIISGILLFLIYLFIILIITIPNSFSPQG